jgi:CBS domain-containing protein
MTTGEVCNRHVVISKPDASLLDAAQLMKNHHVGDVVVVGDTNGQRIPIGILTDRDVALCVADRPKQLDELKVSDVMSSGIVTAPESQSLYDAVKRMQSHGIRRLPIVNAAGGLEGILTFDDIIDLLSEELADLAKLVVREHDRERLPAQPQT